MFLSGVLFLLISLTPLREWLINAIPMNLKLGIAAGICLFLALIGLQNAGLVAGDPVTLIRLGDLTEAKVPARCFPAQAGSSRDYHPANAKRKLGCG
ncbi:MAG: solute carrier family 23 protein [Methyloceanibacter sp.]